MRATGRQTESGLAYLPSTRLLRSLTLAFYSDNAFTGQWSCAALCRSISFHLRLSESHNMCSLLKRCEMFCKGISANYNASFIVSRARSFPGAFWMLRLRYTLLERCFGRDDCGSGQRLFLGTLNGDTIRL